MGRPATGKTPLRNFRAPDDEWSAFRAASDNNMTALIRQFIRWYLRQPGAKLPTRPPLDHAKGITAQGDEDA